MPYSWLARLSSYVCKYWIKLVERDDDDSLEVSRRKDEELFEQRLVQLLNLPIHHVTPAPPPSHAGLLPSGDSNTPPTDMASSFLHLDSDALAQSLSTLPMHLRLGLDKDFLELCEMEAPSSNADSSTLTSNPLADMDLSTCVTTKKKKYTFEFKPGTDSLAKALPGGVETSETVPGTLFDDENAESNFGNIGKEDVKVGPTQLVPMSREERVSSDSDDKLDELLQSTASLTLQQKQPKCRLSERDFAASSAADMPREPTMAPPSTDLGQTVPLKKPESAITDETNTEELDDMLDELLS